MATKFVLVLSALCLMAFSLADQTEWVGSYNEPIYGGSLMACVSLIGGVYYGQGTMSYLGYLRGTIDSSNVWTGNYFLGGLDAIRGTFSLALSSDGLSYSGTYTQTGSTISYTVSSAARLSSATPSDMQCLKADDSMLTTSAPFNMTGIIGGEYTWYTSASGNLSTSSYNYFMDGGLFPGTSEGVAFLNGQLVVDSWYEEDNFDGIEVVLAKNASYVYVTWWGFPSVSYFDYSQLNDPDIHALELRPFDTSSPATAVQKSFDNVCYALWTVDSENSCLNGASTSDDDDDDDDDVQYNLLAATTAFAVVTFILVCATLAVVVIRTARPASPMSSQPASAGNNL